MQAILTEHEIETIAKRVSDKLYAKFISDGSQKQLQEATEKYTKQMIDFYVSENTISYDVKKMISPILDQHLRETKVIESKLGEYMNTEHFKKLELKNLKERVSQIERELENENSEY